jgi:hypothetical protein
MVHERHRLLGLARSTTEKKGGDFGDALGRSGTPTTVRSGLNF